MQQHMSLYKLTFIIDAGQTLFVRHNEMREEVKAASAASGESPTRFWANCSEWTTAEDVTALTAHFNKRDTNVEKFKEASFNDPTTFQGAMDTAVEDNFLEIHKQVINKWRETEFPTGSILFHPDIAKILGGHSPADTDLWLKPPWRMPAVQIWFQILQKYKGSAENVTGNFIQDYNETIALGLRNAGAVKLTLLAHEHLLPTTSQADQRWSSQHWCTCRCVADGSGVSVDNPYSALLKLATSIKPVRASTNQSNMKKVAMVTQHIMQLLHDRWSHPLNSKMETIMQYYKTCGFPPGFLAELKHFKCKACTLCKVSLCTNTGSESRTRWSPTREQRQARTGPKSCWRWILTRLTLTTQTTSSKLLAWRNCTWTMLIPSL
eukprot:1080045-Rhodomonas_salina.1